jgi:hypothetical protein
MFAYLREALIFFEFINFMIFWKEPEPLPF